MSRDGKTRAYVYASDFALSVDGSYATVEVTEHEKPKVDGGGRVFGIEFFESEDRPEGRFACDWRSLASVSLDADSLRFIVAKGADLLGLSVLEQAPGGSVDVDRIFEKFAPGEETAADLAGESPRSRET